MTDTATQDTLAQRLKQVPGLRQLMLLVGIAGAVAIGVTVYFWAQSPTLVPVYSGLAERDMSAMADALASAFHRRVSVNMYVTGAGAETSVSAHNDPHCFVIAQLRGFKRWQIWHHPKYMLTGVTQYVGQHLPRKEQGFGLSGAAIFEGSEELSALGPPD